MSVDEVGGWDAFDPGWPLAPTDEERALVAELRAWEADLDPDLGWDESPIPAPEWVGDPGSDRVLDPSSDESLVLSLRRREVHAADLLALASVDPVGLESDVFRVEVIACLRRVEALVASMRLAAEVALVGDTSSGDSVAEDAVVLEVALASGMSSYAAAKDIEVARALATVFPAFRSALAMGDISEAHARVLVERTAVVVDPGVLGKIEAKALVKAKGQHPGQFRGSVDALVARLDPDAAGRVRKARATRDVFLRPEPDGMAFLGITHTAPVVQAMFDAIATDGRALHLQRGGSAAVRDGDQDATSGTCRADAAAARVLGVVGQDGSVTFDPAEHVKVVVNVVMDLDTLREEDDRAALVDGTTVPAEIAREVAQGAEWFRRLLTAPVTGHLLDYGRAAYCPEPLRRFVLARDQKCRRPGCSTTAMSRLQMDHATPFPDGPTDTANCGALCVRCHQLKTAGYATILDSAADGSMTWLTAFGHRIHVPPRPVLEPDDDPPTTAGSSVSDPSDGSMPPDEVAPDIGCAPSDPEPLEEPPW